VVKKLVVAVIRNVVVPFVPLGLGIFRFRLWPNPFLMLLIPLHIFRDKPAVAILHNTVANESVVVTVVREWSRDDCIVACEQ
jgi:hypothetical protein